MKLLLILAIAIGLFSLTSESKAEFLYRTNSEIPSESVERILGGRDCIIKIDRLPSRMLDKKVTLFVKARNFNKSGLFRASDVKGPGGISEDDHVTIQLRELAQGKISVWLGYYTNFDLGNSGAAEVILDSSEQLSELKMILPVTTGFQVNPLNSDHLIAKISLSCK